MLLPIRLVPVYPPVPHKSSNPTTAPTALKTMESLTQSDPVAFPVFRNHRSADSKLQSASCGVRSVKDSAHLNRSQASSGELIMYGSKSVRSSNEIRNGRRSSLLLFCRHRTAAPTLCLRSPDLELNEGAQFRERRNLNEASTDDSGSPRS